MGFLWLWRYEIDAINHVSLSLPQRLPRSNSIGTKQSRPYKFMLRSSPFRQGHRTGVAATPLAGRDEVTVDDGQTGQGNAIPKPATSVNLPERHAECCSVTGSFGDRIRVWYIDVGIPSWRAMLQP
jgi:hypothetical protein